MFHVKRRHRLVAPVLLGAVVLAGCGGHSSSGASDSSGSTPTSGACPAPDGSAPKKQSFTAAPPMCIDTAKHYTATMTTDAGTLVMSLDAKAAPKTVNNFVVLSRYHFYDGVTFHRVIPGFMAQGGDPQGDGRGGPGYTIEDELPKAGQYRVGSVAMANTGEPHSGGSQFFIVTGDQGVALPPQYALFGQVAKGMDVVKKIEADGATPADQNGTPQKVHTIKSVTIAER